MYRSYSELQGSEKIGRDYAIRVARRNSAIAVMAPHGGGIEPGTSELALAVAGSEYSFYAFEGLKENGNGVLHITSTRFDEPEGAALAASSMTVLAIHGYEGGDPLVHVGGRDTDAGRRVGELLASSGFKIGENGRWRGWHPGNLCNRCQSGRGIQIELTGGLRSRMFVRLSAEGRHEPSGVFHLFTGLLRQALREIEHRSASYPA
ncbi:MAG: poly-gamma-glutamate hydrolase family protein [Desulfobacteraceae bacterium]|nr:poly-gamma-glutamate hydrolase family protein [Desulfobacteraceae bacterium]